MKSVKKMSVEKARKVYQELLQSNEYEINKQEYFKSLIIDAIGELSARKFVSDLYKKNGGKAIFNSASEDSFGRNIRNWINGESMPPFVRNLERKKYLDLLLFLGIHRRHRENRIECFNNDIGILGLEKLYELDFFDFCVSVSIMLEEKTGENAYVIFRQLCNDSELEKIANETGAESSGTFTRAIRNDFNSIEAIGSKDDDKSKKTVYRFVSQYALDFGRRHISRYFAYAALLCGCTIDEIINVLSKKSSQSRIGIREKRDDKIYNYELKDIIQFALTNRQTQKSLYLLSRQMCMNCIKYLHKIDYEEYRKFVLNGKSDEDNRCYMKDEELELELEEIRESFVKAPSGEILDMSMAEFDRMVNNKENITRNMMLATIMTSLSSKVIKKHIDAYGTKAHAAATIEQKINKMLDYCRMPQLNAEISKYDFLLLLAIYNVDYNSIIASNKKLYPYREFIFYDFLDEALLDETIKDIDNDLTDGEIAED
ncbi:MAG: hypothetical protein II984_10475 [Clostridia bacterium]|nr:hypothetical protein [Clostridia bacterium]